MYCYSNNGLSMRCVEPDYVAHSGEWLSSTLATSDEIADQFPGYTAAANNASVKSQILALEQTVTPRRMREAVLGIDNGWLHNIDNQIATLREQL